MTARQVEALREMFACGAGYTGDDPERCLRCMAIVNRRISEFPDHEADCEIGILEDFLYGPLTKRRGPRTNRPWRMGPRYDTTRRPPR